MLRATATKLLYFTKMPIEMNKSLCKRSHRFWKLSKSHKVWLVSTQHQSDEPKKEHQVQSTSTCFSTTFCTGTCCMITCALWDFQLIVGNQEKSTRSWSGVMKPTQTMHYCKGNSSNITIHLHWKWSPQKWVFFNDPWWKLDFRSYFFNPTLGTCCTRSWMIGFLFWTTLCTW